MKALVFPPLYSSLVFRCLAFPQEKEPSRDARGCRFRNQCTVTRPFSSFLRWIVATSLVFAGAAPTLVAQSIFPDKALEAAVRQEVFAKRYNEEPITVEDVKNISEVKAIGKGVENLEGLQHCVALQMVNFRNNKISNLGPMKDLKMLQQNFLNENAIESIEPLSGLTNVQYLELSKNKVVDLTPLKGCPICVPCTFRKTRFDPFNRSAN